MFLTSTLSFLLNGIMSSELQNKVTKNPNYRTLLFTINPVLSKLILNSIIYPTRSWGSLIIDWTTSLGAPLGYDFGGESLTFCIETFRTFVAFSFVMESYWSSSWCWLLYFSWIPIPMSVATLRESISISSPTSYTSIACVIEVDFVRSAMVSSWKFSITKCGIIFQ